MDFFQFQFHGRKPDDGVIHFNNYVYCSNLIIAFPNWLVKFLFLNAKQTKIPLPLVVAQISNYCMFVILLIADFYFHVSLNEFLVLAATWTWVFWVNLVIVEVDYVVYVYRKTHNKGAYKFSKKYKKKDAKEKLNQILEIVHNKNMTAFKNLFSKMVLKQVPDFDQKAGALFDYFQCNSFTHKGLNAMNEKQTWNNGSRQQIVDLSYNVKTDCTAYFLVIRVYIEDTKNEENVGIYSLHIFNLEEGLTQRQVLELETRFDEMDNSLFLPGIYLEV